MPDEPLPLRPPTEVYYRLSYVEDGQLWTLHYRSKDRAQERARQLRDDEGKEDVRLQHREYREGAVQIVED